MDNEVKKGYKYSKIVLISLIAITVYFCLVFFAGLMDGVFERRSMISDSTLYEIRKDCFYHGYIFGHQDCVGGISVDKKRILDIAGVFEKS